MRYSKEYNVWVSKDGVICSTYHGNKLHVISGRLNHGYIRITYCKNKQIHTGQAHRIIWETFNGKIPEGMQIDHINNDRSDNRLINLRLCSAHQNSLYRPGVVFGKLYYNKFGIKQANNPSQYSREYQYYKKHGKCRWEEE